MKADVTVFDSDTKKPLWGSHVILGYHKKMKDSEQRRIGDKYQCKGHVEGVTDKEGKINFVLKVENCPTSGIESEGLYVTVVERGYAKYQQKTEAGKVDVALERFGYKANYPPLKIDYPNYIVDVAKYKSNFDLINEMNRRDCGVGGRLPNRSYLAWEYSRQETAGQEGFDDFLEKIESISSIDGLSLLKEVLDKRYPLPCKSTKFMGESSWRASDYIYDMGREAVSKALLNIADDRADLLMPLSTDIPGEYLQLLKEYGITISTDDYWAYLSGRYASRAHNSMLGQNPRPDPLLFVKSKLKENIDSALYSDSLFKAYQIAVANDADEIEKKHYRWQIDKDRLANELFGLDSNLFTGEVKRLLPGMDVDDMTRKYLIYLYDAGEYEFLSESISANKNLMREFLGMYVIDKRDKPPRYSYGNGENSLILKMPKVTSRIKDEIKTFMTEDAKNMSCSYCNYDGWLRSLALIDKDEAEIWAKKLYLKPYKQDSAYWEYWGWEFDSEKEAIIRGATEAKLTSLCTDVWNLLEQRLKHYSKESGINSEDRITGMIKYFYASCPVEINKLIHDQKTVPVSLRDIDEYFPKDKAMQQMSARICDNEELINRIYTSGGFSYAPIKKNTLNCLCERFEKDLPSLNKSALHNITGYLDKCSPELKEKHRILNMNDWDREITDRTYQGLKNIVKGLELWDSPKPIYDEKFKAFFTGTTSSAQKFKGNMVDWTSGIESDKAFALLEHALNSQDEAMVQAALYAYSFYPSKYTPEIISKLKYYASQNIYPDYLYAAYSLSMNNPADEIVQSACAKSAAYQVNTIESHALNRYDQDFAFNVLVNLDICARVKDEENYRKIMSVIFERDSMGRYESFQRDLERIILSNSIRIDELVEKLLNSSDAVDIILGIRLAELRKYDLDSAQLEKMLNHDDSYVRLAAANYIKANKGQYSTLYNKLKDNTNKKVRKLIYE